MLLLFIAAVPTTARNLSSLFVLISFYFLLLPAAVLSSMQGSSVFVFTCLLLAVLSAVGFSHLFRRMFFSRMRNLESKRTEVQISFWGPFSLLAAILAMLALHVDFVFRYSFAEVYDYRFDFNESLRFPLNYLLPFGAGPLAGFLAALALSRRDYVKLALVLLCGVLFYGFSTHKANLFFPLLTIIVYFAVQSRIGLFYILALVFLSASWASLVMGEPWSDLFGAIFANRLVFIPAQIHYVFFDEFSRVGFLYWAESKLSFGLSESPIPINSVNYIAEIMTGDERIGANVGWIANGYMNFGLIGVFFYSVLLGFVLAMTLRLSRRLGSAITVSTFSVPILNIVTSSDLLVAMLTGGVLPMLVLIWFLSNQKRLPTKY